MTPKQKIKTTILLNSSEWVKYRDKEDITLVNIDDLFDDVLAYKDLYLDYLNEFRAGQIATNINPGYSRHYESNSVASEMFDGTWVGWTYWSGGGKYGEPESIDWLSEAYFLDCTKRQKTVIEHSFVKNEISQKTDIISIPKIVCLCGSAKFKELYEQVEKEETLKGHIVLTAGLFGHIEGSYMADETKAMLDNLHLNKINLASEIIIINPNGYIGESTQKEVEYAIKNNKTVKYLFDIIQK